MATKEGTAPWYATGLRFTCQQCNHCCRGGQPGWVYLNKQETTKIASLLECPPAVFRQRYLRKDENGETVLKLNKNGDCIFWNDGCTIYPVRPTQCRTFPFWSEVLESEQKWHDEAKTCHGMNSGKLYQLDDIKSVLRGRSTLC